MKQALLAATALTGLALTGPAYAGLFVPNSGFNVQAVNSPGSTSSGVNAHIADGLPQPITTTGGTLNLTVNEFPTAGGGEWITFSYSGAPLVGNVNNNWSINEVLLDTNQATIFTQGFISFDNGGTGNLPPIACGIFGNFTVASDPSGAGTGKGCLGAVVSTMLPAGIQTFAPGTFISPFTDLNNTGINPANVTSYFEALHFDPQVVTGVPEPATLTIFGSALALMGMAARRRRS